MSPPTSEEAARVVARAAEAGAFAELDERWLSSALDDEKAAEREAIALAESLIGRPLGAADRVALDRWTLPDSLWAALMWWSTG